MCGAAAAEMKDLKKLQLQAKMSEGKIDMEVDKSCLSVILLVKDAVCKELRINVNVLEDLKSPNKKGKVMERLMRDIEFSPDLGCQHRVQAFLMQPRIIRELFHNEEQRVLGHQEASLARATAKSLADHVAGWADINFINRYDSFCKQSSVKEIYAASKDHIFQICMTEVSAASRVAALKLLDQVWTPHTRQMWDTIAAAVSISEGEVANKLRRFLTRCQSSMCMVDVSKSLNQAVENHNKNPSPFERDHGLPVAALVDYCKPDLKTLLLVQLKMRRRAQAAKQRVAAAQTRAAVTSGAKPTLRPVLSVPVLDFSSLVRPLEGPPSSDESWSDESGNSTPWKGASLSFRWPIHSLDKV